MIGLRLAALQPTIIFIMKIRKIEEKDFELILETDKKLYPTDSPVTKETIRSWYIKNPEFGMIFEKDLSLIGNCIIIPLNKNGWKGLIEGKLKESDLTERYIFANSRDKEICFHIYHIEKFSEEIREFYKIVLSEIASILNNLRKSNESLKIGGFSGLCVTSEGIGLFEDKLNCHERGLIVDEHILEKNGKRIVANSTQESKEKKKQGYTYLNRCKMLVVYPKEQSIIWHYLK